MTLWPFSPVVGGASPCLCPLFDRRRPESIIPVPETKHSDGRPGEIMTQRRIVHSEPQTFMGAPLQEDPGEIEARVGLLGVPYDYGTSIPSVRTGSSQGPAAVRAARTYSYHDREIGEPAVGWFDIDDETDYLKGVTMADCGDVEILAGEGSTNRDRITEAVKRIAANGTLVAAVGGDHSINFPVGRGMERYETVDVVHFDAYADYADVSDGGARYGHGSNLCRLSELPFVHNISILGLRRCTRQEYTEALARDCRIITSRRVMNIGAKAAIDEAVRPARFIYVSIDIGVLDGSLVPGATLPEPEGLTYRLLRDSLAAVCEKGWIVGFDISGLSPPHDFGGGTARLTSWTITHFVSAITAAQG